MAIVTSAQVKTLTGISGSQYDSQITGLIPQIQDFIIDYCKNDFREPAIYVESSNIAFVDGTPDTITDSDDHFDDDYTPNALDHIVVDGSFRNKGRIYQIDTGGVAAGTLTLISTDSVVAEDLSGLDSVRLTLVVFPPKLQLIAADLVKWHLNTGMTIGAVDTGGAIAPAETYPAELKRDYDRILLRLSPYRKAYR